MGHASLPDKYSVLQSLSGAEGGQGYPWWITVTSSLHQLHKFQFAASNRAGLTNQFVLLVSPPDDDFPANHSKVHHAHHN